MLVEILSGRRFHPVLPMQALLIDVTPILQPSGRILHLSGPVVLGNLQTFRADLRKDYSLLTILDLAAVTHVDSTGLGEIVNFYSASRRLGGQLVLVAPSPHVSAMLRMTRVDTILKIVPDIQSALSHANLS